MDRPRRSAYNERVQPFELWRAALLMVVFAISVIALR
jgi:hypothetical protein